MDSQHLVDVAAQSAWYVRTNLEGLGSDDDSTAIPNGGNSLNWILGHIAYWRNEMVRVAGGEPVWREGDGGQYRGNPGERRPTGFDPASALPLPDLLDVFSQATARLESAVRSNPPETEAHKTLLSLLGHETYHAGQLGVLRRLAGKSGAM